MEYYAEQEPEDPDVSKQWEDEKELDTPEDQEVEDPEETEEWEREKENGLSLF